MFAQWILELFGLRSPEESYRAGRAHAAGLLAHASCTTEAARQLWALSETDKTFGGDGYFDQGIADVLKEQGYPYPDQPHQES